MRDLRALTTATRWIVRTESDHQKLRPRSSLDQIPRGLLRTGAGLGRDAGTDGRSALRRRGIDRGEGWLPSPCRVAEACVVCLFVGVVRLRTIVWGSVPVWKVRDGWPCGTVLGVILWA